MSFSVNTYLENLGTDLVKSFSDASQATTPGLIGDARETSARNKLKKVLGNLMDVGEGCVFDSFGNTSKQQDIIISESYLSSCFPVSEANPASYYPCEIIVAAGEVKSTIDSTQLKDVIKKCSSVKDLQRNQRIAKNSSNEHVSLYRKFGSSINIYGTPEEAFSPQTRSVDQILYFAVCEKIALSDDKILEHYIKCRDEGTWFPDFLIDLSGTILSHKRNLQNSPNFEFGQTDSHGILISRNNKHPFSNLVYFLRKFSTKARTVPLESLEQYFKVSLSEESRYFDYLNYAISQQLRD